MPKSKAQKYLETIAPAKTPRVPPLPLPGQLPLVTPGNGAGEYPGPGEPPLRWLEHFFLTYIDLYEAVRRLEKQVYFNVPSAGPVIANPPRPGGGPPDKGGAPPPPPLP